MAKIQCKMCGGMTEVREGATSWECSYCGTLTTFPKLDTEQKENLYTRAEHFRHANFFDKAEEAYEDLLKLDAEDPEVYWGLVLSRFGIEYVEDPTTHERVPTCHRVQSESILVDPDYRKVLEYAVGYDKDIYEKEAKRISEIQKGILRISTQEKPYDVFICYKETTEGGTRTKDSTLAQDIYYQLTNQGLKVFFSPITLEDKLGQQYEPYIFAALNSAKVMLVIGTKKEYFEAVWVKNEWSRFLALKKKDRSKLLIPCYRDMDPYDIPEELSMFLCQDMSKIGFIQDILHGVMKVVNAGKTAESPAATTAPAAGGKNPLLIRAQLFVEYGDFPSALEFCEKVLNTEPQNGEVYFCRLLAELQLSDEAKLFEIYDLENNKTFKLALRFADDALKSKLDAILRARAEEKDKAERKRNEKAEAERKRREEKAEARRKLHAQIKEIKQASVAREQKLARAKAAEFTLHGSSDLHNKLVNCLKAERMLRTEVQPSPEDALSVKAATDEVLAQVGDLTELERLVEEKKRQDRKKRWMFALIVICAVTLLINIIVISCNAISERKEEARLKKLSTGDFVLDLPHNVKLAMMNVEAGTFEMSAEDGENDSDEVAHQATLTKDFFIGKTEVTQAQWKAVMKTNPSICKGDNLPVEHVSWNDAMVFCEKLNDSGKAPSGWKFTLPTETQWEYAARGGKKSKGYKYSGSNDIDEVARISNSGFKTHPVGKKKANELGLYDMSGNVSEWCLDDMGVNVLEGRLGDMSWLYEWDPDMMGKSDKATAEFTRGNDRSYSFRVCRGGCFSSNARGCRSASRGFNFPDARITSIGFRLALVPDSF